MTRMPHGTMREAVVDTGAIEDNVRHLRRLTSSEVIAVVKADGYGHGAVRSARAARCGAAGSTHRSSRGCTVPTPTSPRPPRAASSSASRRTRSCRPRRPPGPAIVLRRCS